MTAKYNFSILPRIKTQAHGSFLRLLALGACEGGRFEDDADVIAQVASVIMSEAISRTEFHGHGGGPSMGYPYSRQGNPNFENAKSYVETCLGKFDSLIPSILQEIITVSSAQVDKQVEEVMVPILRLIAEYRRNHSEFTSPLIDHYIRWTAESYFKMITRGTGRYCVDSSLAERFIAAMTLPGGPELLVTMSVVLDLVFNACSFIYSQGLSIYQPADTLHPLRLCKANRNIRR